MITMGIDPHKSSLTAVAVGSPRESVATIRIALTATTVGQLQEWATRWPRRRWAVEGAEGLGRGVAQGLASAGEQVVDVPAQLAARARLLNSGHARKTDALDAASVAAVAVHHPRLRLVRAEGHSVGLRLLSDRRDDLAEERTRTANRLHALLRDLIAGGAKRNLTATHAAGLLRTVHPLTPADQHRKSLAQDLLADLRRLDRALLSNAAQIQAAVSASKTTLTLLHGIGPVRRTVLTGPVVRALDDYLAGRTTGSLFITTTGRGLDQPEAWRMIHRLARHADPRTTRRYDRGRHSLDRHASYALTAWLNGSETED
jgi:transposase